MPDDARSQVFAAGMLDGQVALVTGGGTGLGKATALELARCGARVVIAGRRARVLREAVAEIRARIGMDARGVEGLDAPGAGGAVDWVAGDVREPDDARRLIQTALRRHGRLDMLVNNAGGQYYTPAEGIVAKGWRAVWRLNVEGMLNMAESAVECGLGGARAGEEGPEEGGKEEEGEDGMGARPLACTRGGTIVNVTLSPHHGMPGMAHSGRPGRRSRRSRVSWPRAGPIAPSSWRPSRRGTTTPRRWPSTRTRSAPGWRARCRCSVWASRGSTRGSWRCCARRWGAR